MPALAEFAASSDSSHHPQSSNPSNGQLFFPSYPHASRPPSHFQHRNGGFSTPTSMKPSIFAPSQQSTSPKSYPHPQLSLQQQQPPQQQHPQHPGQQPQHSQAYHPQQHPQQAPSHHPQHHTQAAHEQYSAYGQMPSMSSLLSRNPNPPPQSFNPSQQPFNPSSFNPQQAGQAPYGYQQIPVGAPLLSSLSSHSSNSGPSSSPYQQPPFYLPSHPQLNAGPHPSQRPVLLANRVLPQAMDYSRLYDYQQLKPGRLPPFDLLTVNLHKKKVNLACHFCDHAARRPGRQKTALLISCQSPHCRKVFCSRPSCYKKLPAELGINSPDRFAEWKRQVETGQGGASFICPHCRDEAACPGPQCAKRWKKRHARMANKKTSGGAGGNGGFDGDGVRPNGGPNGGPMSVLKAEAADKDVNGMKTDGESTSDESEVSAEVPAGNGAMAAPRAQQQQRPAVAAFNAAAVPFAAAPQQLPRMDVLAGVTTTSAAMSTSTAPVVGGGPEAVPAHQQLLQFLQQGGNTTQQAMNGGSTASFTSASMPSADPQASYQLTAFTGAGQSSSAAAAMPGGSPPATSYPYMGQQSAGGYAFTSPNLSPLLSPQPQSTSHLQSSLASQGFSSNSPVLAPLSPMTNASPPSFFSPSPRMIATVPSLSLNPTGGLFSPVGPQGMTGEEGKPISEQKEGDGATGQTTGLSGGQQ